MRVARLAPAAFLYLQGLSLANPVYLIFLSLFLHKLGKAMFKPGLLALFVALVLVQLIAVGLNPHLLPASVVASVIGLLAFAIKPQMLFAWDQSDGTRRAFHRVLLWVLLFYFLDSLLRVGFLDLNFTGWTDYELKEWVKTRSYLADDTNTLAIRVIFLYFIAWSVGLVRSRPWAARLFFLYLMLTCYSRAGLLAMLIVFALENESARRALRRFPLLLVSTALGIAGVALMSITSEDLLVDSSVISKLDLVTGSIDHWISSDWLTRLIGAGYYSNINVGAVDWAAGHSIVYYALVDFGMVGTLLIGVLMYRQARSLEGRYLLSLYCLLGLSVFRFDFLFLYITLFFVDHVATREKN